MQHFILTLQLCPSAVDAQCVQNRSFARQNRPFKYYLIDVKLQPNNHSFITIFSRHLDRGRHRVDFSGTEQGNATLSVVAPPANPVLVAQLGNVHSIPSTPSQRVTVTCLNINAYAC
jgi:hypothetical protein